MAETAKDDSAKSAASSAGNDLAAFKKELLGEFKGLVAGLIGEAVKPLVDNQKVLADTLAALPPAAKEKKEEKDAEAAKPLGAEDVTKIVSEAIKADRAAQSQASAASEKKTAARNKVLAAKGLDKLPATLINLPDSDDEAALNAAADALVKDLNASGVKLPNVGGAGKDGGTAAASAAAAAAQGAAASKGFLQMPGAAPAAAA